MDTITPGFVAIPCFFQKTSCQDSKQAGLVRREIEGRVHHVYLNAEPLEEAERWVNRYRQYWEASLDSLEAWLVRREKGRTK